jgi:hypothetical protein
MITASAYDIHVEKLFDRMRRLHGALESPTGLSEAWLCTFKCRNAIPAKRA